MATAEATPSDPLSLLAPLDWAEEAELLYEQPTDETAANEVEPERLDLTAFITQPTRAELERLAEEYGDRALALRVHWWTCMTSAFARERGRISSPRLGAADRSVDWFFEDGVRGVRDQREVSRPALLSYAAPVEPVTPPVVDHYNYWGEPVYYRTCTPREVSMWATTPKLCDSFPRDLRQYAILNMANRTVDAVTTPPPPQRFPPGNKGLSECQGKPSLWRSVSSRLSDCDTLDLGEPALPIEPAPHTEETTTREAPTVAKTPRQPTIWESNLGSVAVAVGHLASAIANEWSVWDVLGW
ncbi:MAG: hypothetical protein M1825_003115 [Sarcosagium campestre]|nr:MAG: hypothetical protein M1825_003115 [Sarcosagium campestre]